MTTFNPSTHAASVSDIAFTPSNPGSIYFSDVTLSYSVLLIFNEKITTQNLRGTVATPNPPGAVDPVTGSFAITNHTVAMNSALAQCTGVYPMDVDFSTAPYNEPKQATVNPLPVPTSGSGATSMETAPPMPPT